MALFQLYGGKCSRESVISGNVFANLPDEHPSRWGENLTAEKMRECVWLRPEAVAQIEFLEWTAAEKSAQTTHVRRAQPEKFRITHPFHPLSGWEFEALACKECSGEQRV
jgi:hypothetical protein